ncbi:T9SS-dependent choice-of-anchor J family protein [Aureispira sp. CCB-E]|uniref:T9SS-dependent choice-of-anchor J family protein n=1 Tax=Aureispira sp. CCB-E TaxID=3051121 RepID=UPI002868EDA2|nr:T9SS type A sorting domain-containing protein [Aureispira sp. CCB-E]WMX15638.1 T9SS type A sorting domain-containing protein [Aureispira sp. CCB-E]
MKKFLLSALCALSTTALVQAQIAKKPLIEHFTQASCGPCASQNPTMYNTLNNFGTANYTKITYQVSWPGTDPMNAEYPAGPNDRRNYYSVSGVPDASLNGGATAAPNTAVTSSTLSNAAALTTPYEIRVNQTWTSGTSVDVNVVIKNVTSAAIADADRFHLAMVEENITFASAPGSNGETAFFYVVRDMYDASTGSSSTAGATIGSIPAGDSIMYTLTVTPPSYIRDLNQVSFVGFVQNNGTKVVHQSTKSTAGNVPGLLNVGATANSTVGAGYCNYNFTPSVNFTNNGSIPVTSVTAQYTINGGAPISETYTGNLASGQSTAITFPGATLAAGSSNVEYTITDVNNGGTYSQGPVTMAPESYSKLPTTAAAAPLTEGMESAPLTSGTGYSRTLATGIFDADASIPEASFSVLDGPTYNYGAIGGMAASNRSIRFRFFGIQSGSMSVVMNKVNLGAGSAVSFDHAYRQYSSENDRLEVEVSTDCGATWTTVWNQAGSALMTLPASQTQFVPSAASDWRSTTVDLTAYDNTNDVVIRFKGTSAYGNNLFLDNINIADGVVSVNNVQKEAAEVRIMPNPVSSQMTLEFTMENTADANINIVNALGQQVQQVANGSFSGTNVLEVNTSELAAGVYFVNIVTEQGKTTKRFVRQ